MKAKVSIESCHDLLEIGAFYKQWTGQSYNRKRRPWMASFVVARDNENGKGIVGCGQLVLVNDPFFDKTWGLIENIFVHSKHRRAGIGSAIMKYLEKEAGQFGCEFIKLTSRKKEGQALYESLGYEEGKSFRKELS